MAKFNFEQYVPGKRHMMERCLDPMLAFHKSQMYFNSAAVKMIGEEHRFVACFYDKEASVIGFCFTKDPFSRALSWRMPSQKEESRRRICATGFYREYPIMEKVEKLGKEYFPLVVAKDYKHPDYEGSIVYIVSLR